MSSEDFRYLLDSLCPLTLFLAGIFAFCWCFKYAMDNK